MLSISFHYSLYQTHLFPHSSLGTLYLCFLTTNAFEHTWGVNEPSLISSYEHASGVNELSLEFGSCKVSFLKLELGS